MWSQIRTLWTVVQHTFMRNETVQYPEEMPYASTALPGPHRPDEGPGRRGALRRVQPVCRGLSGGLHCLAKDRTEEDGRWYPEFFRINFSRCIMCGMCEEACPTYAIQLTPDFELCEFDRNNMVYEKEHLLDLVVPVSTPTTASGTSPARPSPARTRARQSARRRPRTFGACCRSAAVRGLVVAGTRWE